MLGRVKLKLMCIRELCVVSTCSWSKVIGAMYARSSEDTSETITKQHTTETAAPDLVRSLKSSSVFGYTSSALTRSGKLKIICVKSPNLARFALAARAEGERAEVAARLAAAAVPCLRRALCVVGEKRARVHITARCLGRLARGMASAGEQLYTLQGVADDIRDDGRSRLDFRHFTLEVGLFPQTGGSARLQVGGTDVLVAVTTELAEPDVASPDMGIVLVSIDCGPGPIAATLPNYSSSSSTPEERVLWLEAAMQPLYASTSIPDALRALCIVSGVQCWQLRVHAQLLRVDGCPLDAISLAAAAALRSTRIPRMSAGGAVDEEEEEPALKKKKKGTQGGQLDLDLDESLDDSVPFDCRFYAPASALPRRAPTPVPRP